MITFPQDYRVSNRSVRGDHKMRAPLGVLSSRAARVLVLARLGMGPRGWKLGLLVLAARYKRYFFGSEVKVANVIRYPKEVAVNGWRGQAGVRDTGFGCQRELVPHH